MPNKNGLHLITPTSIVSTGSGNSSSINTNGSVTFSSCETLSLNGVFSADYDNYMVVMRFSATSSAANFNIRLRASGADNSTASSYVLQYIDATSTTVGASRTTSNLASFGGAYSAQRSGTVTTFFGPHLAQPTAFRTVSAYGYLDAYIYDTAITHNQSVSYDGFTVYPATGSVSGLVAVYGMRK